MKFKKLLPVLALLFAVITSFAFRSIERNIYLATSCTWFDFTGTAGQEHDPSKYTATVTPPPSCPDPAQQLCAICVRSSEKYTSGANNGKPMVDDNTTSIYARINAALATPKHDIFVDDTPNNGVVDIDEAVDLKPL